jgi:membrane protease YdiL (CAAX protease family)
LADTRLTGPDKRALFLWILCGIIGAVFAHKYFFRAFPEASVDFKISRADAQKRAKSFVEELGETLNGYQSTIVFEVSDDQKTYLERELGLQEANRLMASELSIWYWEIRFFRPQQEEEFRVRVSPAGKVVGYEHHIEEARGAKSLNRDEAENGAQQFLTSNLGIDLSNWNFLPEEANSVTRPNRLDWSFTWERKGFKAKDAPYRLQAGVQGDHIGGTQAFLQVPEAWTRDYQHLRSTNDFYELIAIVPYLLMFGAVTWIGIALWRQGRTSWRGAIMLGLAVGFLFFLMQINQWQTVRAGYDTHQAYSSFATKQIVLLLLGALGTALTVTLVLPGGEPLYREAQPENLRLGAAFTPRGVRSKEFFCSSLVGLCLAAAHIGFIVAFYMLGRRVGVWAPQDLKYSDVVNTPLPWVSGMAIGVLASTSEEFLFRLFGVHFLHKLTRSRILAVLLPAFFWGFLHSNYPQEPGYTRGIEVGLIGIVAGLVMLRWGIVATLIWHYTVDASLVGMLLIRSDNLYFKISGIVVGLAALAPLLFSGVLYLTRGRFEEVEDLLNKAKPEEPVSLAHLSTAGPAVVAARRYDALTTSMLGFLALCVVLGGLAAWRLKRERIGDYVRMTIDRRSATALADAAMKEHGLDPLSFRKAALFLDATSAITNEFLHRRMSVAEINKIYEQRTPGALWRVRYFRDSQPEEFAITLKPNGSVQGFWHTLAEAAKGANLPKEQAVAIAEQFLRKERQVDLSGWKLVGADSDKRPNRTDHTLTWQQDTPLDPGSPGNKEIADHAYERIEVKVLGDEPVDFRTYIKIPEEFQRKQQEENLPRTLFFVGRIVLAVGFMGSIVGLYFKRFRTAPVVNLPWRRLLLWALAGSAAYIVSMLFSNDLPTYFSQYRTELPLKLYQAALVIAVLIRFALIAGAMVFVFGMSWFFGARAFREEQLPSWLGMPGKYYRDAFWIALGGSGALIAVRRVLDFAATWWPTKHDSLPSAIGNMFDAIYPGIGALGGVVLYTFLLTAVLLLGAAFIAAEIRVRWLRLLLFFAIAAAFVTGWGSPADFLKEFLTRLILLAMVVFGIRAVVRFNMLGLFLLVTCTGLLAAAVELLGQPDTFYRINGYGLLCAIAVLLAWPLLSWRLAGNSTQEVMSSEVHQ